MKNRGSRLVVFAKTPIPGQVKTRLIPTMGAGAAATLYEKLIVHSLATAVKAGVAAVELWCTPSYEHPFFIQCAREFHVELREQRGRDIGQRMAHAFYETLKISDSVLLVGSDVPCLTCADLREAMALLQQEADAVISPAEDGGYVLLGLRRYTSKIFSGISWGTDLVLAQTRACLRNLGWHWHELPTRWDVDRPEDVQRLILEGLSHLVTKGSPYDGFSNRH
jgi:rSAM/selenodomain-associated transferase 1